MGNPHDGQAMGVHWNGQAMELGIYCMIMNTLQPVILFTCIHNNGAGISVRKTTTWLDGRETLAFMELRPQSTSRD
jgi:hypothetical protein